jgi:hypothetical protein
MYNHFYYFTYSIYTIKAVQRRHIFKFSGKYTFYKTKFTTIMYKLNTYSMQKLFKECIKIYNHNYLA